MRHNQLGNSIKYSWIICLALWLGLQTSALAQRSAQNQLNELFSQMKSGLDSDLAGIIDDAIKNNRDYIELNGDQLRRFRQHPLNPFEGLDHIDTNKIGGKIKLHFEVPTVRNRTPDINERQHNKQLSAFDSVCTIAAESTVNVLDEGQQVALGTVISKDGLIVTKYSEVKKSKRLQIRLNNGSTYSARIFKTNRQNDIAILTTNAKNLRPVSWSQKQPLPGAYVITTDAKSKAVALGTYSSVPRSLVGENQAVLGVNPVETNLGLKIERVSGNSAAMLAGLQVGDVITKIDGKMLRTLNHLVTAIRQNRPGDKIAVEYIREGQVAETVAELGGRDVSGPNATRFKMMNRFGTIPSRRNTEFPLVFQHDTPLLPEHCGGPILDLDGNVLGINIARGGRVAAYAIPANHVKSVIDRMINDEQLVAENSN